MLFIMKLDLKEYDLIIVIDLTVDMNFSSTLTKKNITK